MYWQSDLLWFLILQKTDIGCTLTRLVHRDEDPANQPCLTLEKTQVVNIIYILPLTCPCRDPSRCPMLGLHGQGGDLQGCVVHQVDGHQQSNKDIIVWLIPCQAARPSCSRVGLPEGSHVPGGGLQGLHDWVVHQGGGHQPGCLFLVEFLQTRQSTFKISCQIAVIRDTEFQQNVILNTFLKIFTGKLCKPVLSVPGWDNIFHFVGTYLLIIYPEKIWELS